MRMKLLVGAAVLAVALGSAITQVAADTPRQEAMKEMGKNMKTIKEIVSAGGPAADVAGPAQKIAEIAAKIPGLFPQGSDMPDDEAKTDIWQNWDDFTTKAKALQDEAAMLASAAGGGDIATVGAQFEKVGGSCGSCHKAYREQKN
ncbi:cytochrome c [Dongia sp.]|uniref:c-type cytochrome n=1 Tax=Dongia sp. TaxID=1977262 RepID=UPI0035AE08B3